VTRPAAPTARPGRAGRITGRLGPLSSAGSRYLDRPYASLQLLLLAGAGLLGFGVLMAASTTIAAAHDTQAQMWTQLIKEIEFVTLGVPTFWVAMRIPPRVYRMLAYPALLVGLLGLMAVLVPGIGVLNDTNARRWVDLGPLQLQPSEFAKLAVLLWGADLLARKLTMKSLSQARHLFIPLLPVFVFVFGLLMLEPDLGTTMCFMLILLGLLWTVGLPFRYFTGVVVMIAAAVTVLAVSAPYRLERLLTFTHPFKDAQNSGYHTVEGLYALASGGIFGVGLGNGTSKYSWVPNSSTDYVFSVIGEELGLIGSITVLLFFGLFAFAGMRISSRNVDPFVRIAAGGATVWICGQALINVGYVTALLPVTGIPLPFISAGGTSLIATFLVFGMLISFARHEPDAVAAAQRAAAAGQRGRVERWLRVPVPKAYVAPKRRVAAKTPTRSVPAGRAAATKPAAPRTAAPRAAAPRAAAPRAAAPRAAAPRAAAPRAAAPRPTPRPAPRLRSTGTDGPPRNRPR
jgi:cell division protein FtsW